jgi:hypothetical protein
MRQFAFKRMAPEFVRKIGPGVDGQKALATSGSVVVGQSFEESPVSVQHALLVGVVQSAGDSGDDRDSEFGMHACRVPLLNQLGCVGPVDVVHRNPQLATVFPTVMYPDDMRVAQTRGQVSLTDEPLPERCVAGHVGTEDLPGLLARQPGMLDQVDLAHAPGPEQPQDSVTRRKCHRSAAA